MRARVFVRACVRVCVCANSYECALARVGAMLAMMASSVGTMLAMMASSVGIMLAMMASSVGYAGYDGKRCRLCCL